MTTETKLPGLVTIEHRLTVPLVHGEEGGETIEVFAREVAAPDGRDRPFLVFLQGGPGHEAPRPESARSGPAWLGRALKDFRVLMLDQRGTGLSTPYDAPGPDPAADAERLRHFRADAIVQDAERFREHLGAQRWSVLGQSFGGFCALHYLSVAPDSLREVFFTGGLPPVGRPADEIYAGTLDAMRVLNERYHRRFPQDRSRLRRLLELCDEGAVRDPHGNPISRRLMRTIGHPFGMDGGAETLHHLLEHDPTSAAFSHDAAALLAFGARNPIYAVLHESCCADGGATRWSADRVLPDDFAGDSLLLTGEHLFPWHFEDDPLLRPYREVAALLAEHEWPRLYDADVLARVDVPCAAIIYADDPYVLRGFSEETAALVPSMRPWLTNEYLHNGLRTDGERILDRLISLARDL
ncbi:alpha/beta fold hydrolase [Nocardioides marmoribigeumensis]|uniref:Pimeloyl-ACP methyl ester carboxylesterase n=1 Tax=Nocardioides marmoribigeumensis TaxID=433649 RepID=A0ABU2BPU4_9ACTN|nr:alpha/beta fold hydrolase [Nocardioides marmoribigeumensis]MDR7360650.1 pimeloyl-ACP methyl ester carboxylesterase [Nocardioides marmoribigeumensis]